MELFSTRSTGGHGANTASVATAADYQARAVDRIREILAAEHAAVRRELESRIAEGHWSGSGENIDPHHITNALRELVRLGELESVTGATRGGADVETLQPPIVRAAAIGSTAPRRANACSTGGIWDGPPALPATPGAWWGQRGRRLRARRSWSRAR